MGLTDAVHKHLGRQSNYINGKRLASERRLLIEGSAPVRPTLLTRRNVLVTPRTCRSRKLREKCAAASLLAEADPSAASSLDENLALLERYSEQVGLEPRLVLRLATSQPALVELPARQLRDRLLILSTSLSTSLQGTAQIVLKFPRLLELVPEEVGERYAWLVKVLNLTVQQLRAVIALRPELLTAPPADVAVFEQTCSQLSLALQVPRPTAAEMLARLPAPEFEAVAALDAAELRARVQELCGLLSAKKRSRKKEDASTTGAQDQLGVLLMLMKSPSILALSTEQVLLSLDTMAYVFHGPLRHFAGVLSHVPRLVTVPPTELRSNFDALLTLLGCGHRRCSRLALMEPRLLMLSPTLLSQRLEALQHMLYLDRSQAAQVAVRQPFVLLYRSEYLEAKLSALMAATRLTPEVVASMVIRRPRLLLTSTQKMLGVMDSLTQLLQLPRGIVVRMIQAQPVLLTQSQDKLEANFTGHLELLGGPRNRWARQVAANPILLTISPSSLKQSVDDLASLLGLPEQQVVIMAGRNAAFLCVSLRQCKSNYDLVVERLGVDPELLSAAVATAPFILSMPTERLQSRCFLLSRLISSSPVWRSQLSSLLPHELSALVGLNNQQMEHLQFIAKQGRQAELPLMDPSLLDRGRFIKRFPAFRKAVSWKYEGRGTKGLPPLVPPEFEGRSLQAIGSIVVEETAAAQVAEERDMREEEAVRESGSESVQEQDGVGEAEPTLRKIPVTQQIAEGGRKWIGRGMKSQEIL